MTDRPQQSADARPTDVVLSGDDCLMHRGPLAHPGRLELTPSLVTFTLRNVIDRIAGAEDVVIQVEEITEIAAGGVNYNLDISTEANTHKFSGRGAMRVHARLMALMVEYDDVDEDTQALFEPGECVLVQGQGDLYMNDLMAVRGEVTLTDRRFRFMPGLGLERLLWNAAQLDVPLDDLVEWELQGIRRLFRLTLPNQEVRIGGPLAHQLYAQIDALRTGGQTSGTTADDAVLETWKVSLRRGPVAHPGDLSISPAVLMFQPTGLLDAIMGVKPFSIQTEAISAIRIRGWSDKRAEFIVGHETYALNIPEIDETVPELIELVRSRHDRLSREALPDEPRHVECLDRWAEAIQYDDSEQIVVAAVAVEMQSRTEIRFGWLLLTRSRVMFLPIGGPASREHPLVFPLESICRLDGGPRTPDDQVYLSANDQPFRFLLAPREGIVEEFWEQCRSPSRILPWSSLGPRSMSRITGEARFLRIVTHGETIVDMSPALTVAHAQGVAMMLPGEPGSSVPIGTWVTVEIGQTEGVYQFDSRVTRSAPLPLETNVPNPNDLHLLITAFPDEIRVYNQRDSYRVPTHMHLRAHVLTQTADGGSWMATGDAFECDLIDLSIGGCCLRSHHHIEDSARVTLNIPLMEQWVELRATCVRGGEPDPELPGMRYGMEFRELTMAHEDMLHKAIMFLQREAIGEEGDETADDEG